MTKMRSFRGKLASERPLAKPGPVSPLATKKRPPISERLRPILPRIQLLEACIGGFIGLVGAAMVLYPGGTRWDSSTKGHRFWENSLWDLLGRRSLSGAPNLMTSRLAEVGLLALLLALIWAFTLAPEIIPTRKRLGKQLLWLGVGAALSVCAARLLISNTIIARHPAAILITCLPLVVALTGMVGAILAEPKAPPALRGVSILLLILVALSFSLHTWDVGFNGPSLRIQPGLERVANLALIGWLMLIAKFVRFRLVEAFRFLSARQRRT